MYQLEPTYIEDYDSYMSKIRKIENMKDLVHIRKNDLTAVMKDDI